MITVLNELSILFLFDRDKMKKLRFHPPVLLCPSCGRSILLKEAGIAYENHSKIFLVCTRRPVDGAHL